MPPPPSSNKGIPAKFLAATATTALAAAPFDVSGIAIFTAVVFGTLALVGLAYHGGRKALHKTEARVAKHHEKKDWAAKQPSPESQSPRLKS